MVCGDLFFSQCYQCVAPEKISFVQQHEISPHNDCIVWDPKKWLGSVLINWFL